MLRTYKPRAPTMSADVLQTLLTELAEGAVTLDDAVIGLADADRGGDIAALIAARLAVDADIVGRALTARWQEAAATLCRTAGLGANGYSAVLRMRRRAGRTLDASPAALLAGYLKRPRASREELTELLHVYARPAAK
jgi:hypothetical protein